MGGGTAHAIRQDANDTTGTLSSHSRRFVEGRFYLRQRRVAQVRKRLWKVREQKWAKTTGLYSLNALITGPYDSSADTASAIPEQVS